MAGTLLHITLADQALDATSLDAQVKGDLKEAIDDYRLGAICVDLPYYHRLGVSFIKYALGLELRYAYWGTRLHTKSPNALALALLDRADTPAGRARSLGFLTHMAVDVVFHNEINRLVTDRASGNASVDTLHKQIEDQLDLFVHLDTLGHSGMGTPYARQMLGLRPDNKWVIHLNGGNRADPRRRTH